MKSIGKIYKGLTPRAAAMVAWGLSSRGSQEVEQIAASVGHEYRLAPAREFGETIIWLDALTRAWAIIHWRLKYDHANAIAAFTQCLDRNKLDSAIAEILCRLRAAEGRLLSCDQALNDAAVSFGFDAQIVRDLVTTTTFMGTVPDAENDPGFTAEVWAAITGGCKYQP